MTPIVEWLLDLDRIRLQRDAPLLLEWHSRLPAWLLVCLALAAFAWVGMVYRHEKTTPGRRTLLAAFRLAILALVVAVICGPALVLQRNRVEPSHVTLLIDVSQSMATRERYDDEPLARDLAAAAGLEDTSPLAERSRLDLIRAGLTRDEAMPLQRLLDKNVLHVASFAGDTTDRGAAASTDSLPALIDALQGLSADGVRTDVAGAIAQVLEHAEGRPTAAIVLASDGQETESHGLRDVLAAARDRQIPIFPIRVGNPTRPTDVDVGPLRAESSVFVNDLVAVEATLTAHGLVETTPITVNLVDERTDAVAQSRTVIFEPEQQSLTLELQAKPTEAGTARFRVEVPPLPGEYATDNNADRVEFVVVDAHLRVLYVEGYPRYEYRYLKNALLREEGIDLSVLLIDADERFVQEGSDPIRRFPETPEELNRFDVVLFGDVDARSGWLTIAQMNMLLDFVGNEGGGFGLIAGERAAPHRFLGTPLEKLIPVRIDPEFTGRYASPLTSGYRLQLTPEGRRSRLFRTVANPAPDAESATDSGIDTVVAIFESLPEQFWIARTLGPRPGASVLAEHPTMQVISGAAAGSGLMPLVVIGRYGAGRIFFQATDDTWRWRRHTGELLHDTYWVQVARELMRGERLSQSRRLVLHAERRTYDYGAPVHVQVEVSDTRLLVERPDAIELSVWERNGNGGDAQNAASPSSEGSLVSRFQARRLSAESRRYEGTFIPSRPGRYVIQVDDVARMPGERPTSAAIRVERPDLEAQRPEANHELLERVASTTGGRVVELDDLAEAFGSIRDRSIQIPDDVTEPLWDSKLVLILFLLFITTEWILRKAFGLL